MRESEMKVKKRPTFQASPLPGGSFRGRPTNSVTTGGARQTISDLEAKPCCISLCHLTSGLAIDAP
jgi:hypothetical protein